MGTIEAKPHIDVQNEILSIQVAAINIAAQGIKSNFTIHKKPVDSFTLDYLAAYFSTSITPATEHTPAYLKIVSDACIIIVELKK